MLSAVRRIENGIKRERIVDIEARMLEKKKDVSDEQVETIPIERRNKRKFNEEEAVKGLSHSSPHASFLSLRIFAWGNVGEANSNYLGTIKGRGLKCTIHSKCPMLSYFLR